MNGPMRRVAIALFVIFAVLILDVTYWQVVRADDLRADGRNSRELLSRTGRERGLILSADGLVLARSVPDTADSQRFIREYPFAELYAHTVGYSSLLFGDSGIEDTQAEVLSSGRDLTISGLLSALLGEDVRARSVQLSLVHALQNVAAEALGDQEGAVVALDPRTGEVLVAVSSPSFDPNSIVFGNPAEFDRLQEDPAEPLLDRTIRETYSPGSTFKTIVAVSAVESGVAGPDTLFPNPQELELPQSTATIENFGGALCGSAEEVALEEAFLRSCNTTFALLGMRLAGDAVVSQAEAFGFNREIPYDFGVLPSVIPEADTFRNDLAALAQTSLGERDVQATAMQMALVAAGVANEGTIMAPYLVEQIFDADSNVDSTTEARAFAEVMGAGTAQVLREMMERVVTAGTGTRAQIPGVRVGGKTGTAEAGEGPPHAWFIGFAPVEDPRIAIAVVVANGGNVGENATGGAVAAPIAQEVMAFYLASGG
ncbi:MAG: penicillin-binding transpeptidase domain-containing protein [Acidimicrobiia bacterium]|nr:penicillin-binding transpeptidase domain-containing protein [Acidimicrobiia bacterium]